ncbi:MAG: hypothetical protein HYW25_03250 [Candidatus Aenigmarchaeota archaeon]|nr:hypothetical protein [Candidatus Aenigmarchaeota archaeon]
MTIASVSLYSPDFMNMGRQLQLLKEAGADVIVAASYIFGGDHRDRMICSVFSPTLRWGFLGAKHLGSLPYLTSRSIAPAVQEELCSSLYPMAKAVGFKRRLPKIMRLRAARVVAGE